MSPQQIQNFINARTEKFGRGFSELDVDQVSACMADKGLVFNDIAMNEYKMEKVVYHKFMAQNFNSMKFLRILESQTTGTLDFTAWEMLLEIEYNVDEPLMKIKKGEKGYVRGVTLQWWQWEGGDDDTHAKVEELALEKWKIIRENDYMVPLQGENVGVKERILS